MHDFSLTSKQLSELRLAHGNESYKYAADRIKAVYSLGMGYSVSDVASILMLSDETIRNYMKSYQAGGLSALVQNRHQGRACFLNDAELMDLSHHLENHTYLDVESIACYVSRTFNINYSMSGLTQLLHRLGFVYKKAKAIPSKADSNEQQAYLEALLNLLKNKDKKGPHYFVDGVHPQHNTAPAYGWIKQGKEAVIKTNTGRRRINLNGALNADTLSVVVRSDASINAQSTIELFKQLESKHTDANTIYVTLDNARYYRSRLVQSYLEDSKIQCLFLPPYSPNLNLIERLWKYMKKVVLRNRYYEKFEDFREAIFHFFSHIKSHQHKLSTLLTMNFHILDAG